MSDEKLSLTRGVCKLIRPVMREMWDCSSRSASGGHDKGHGEYLRYDVDGAFMKLGRILDSESISGSKRGGVTIDLHWWKKREAILLRDILLVVLKDMTQAQVRRSLKQRIQQLDNHIGVSAVEVLGRVVSLRVAS